MHISDFTEQDEIDAQIVYRRCPDCGNHYAANILAVCPICKPACRCGHYHDGDVCDDCPCRIYQRAARHDRLRGGQL